MKAAAKKRGSKSARGIQSIAEGLGISKSTVHRALHNQGRVDAETRARVLRLAEETGYKPNLAARDLRLNRHFRVSVHLPSTIAAFFDCLREGIEEGATLFRSVLEVEYHSYRRSGARLQADLNAALKSGVDGIIAVPANSAQMMQFVTKAKAAKVPVIFVSTDVPESGRLSAVTPYPYFAGCMAAEVLSVRMKKRSHVVLLAGDLKNSNQAEKIRGFTATLAQSKLGLRTTVIETRDVPEKAYECMVRCTRETSNLGGLYVTSANSVPALRALRDAGRLRALPIVTTDLIPELVPYLREGIVDATVYQCPEEQGLLATRAMYHYLTEGQMPPSNLSVIPQLVMKSNLDLYLGNLPVGARIKGRVRQSHSGSRVNTRANCRSF